MKHLLIILTLFSCTPKVYQSYEQREQEKKEIKLKNVITGIVVVSLIGYIELRPLGFYKLNPN